MNDADADEIGIRITPPNLVYTNGQRTRWFGSGILNKPIGDFLSSSDRLVVNNPIFLSGYTEWHDYGEGITEQPYFSTIGNVIKVHSRAIPEPSSIAFVAGLILLFIVVLKNAYEKRNGK